jgi:hypothetical protein
VRNEEQANGANFPIPNEPPAVPTLSEAPEDFVRLHHGVLNSPREPRSPVVLKSLILKKLMVSSVRVLIPRAKKSFVFLTFWSFQNSSDLIKAFSRDSTSGRSELFIWKVLNSISVIIPFRLASKEFWQISLARDFSGDPWNVSIPEWPMPFISPLLFEGKDHLMRYSSFNENFEFLLSSISFVLTHIFDLKAFLKKQLEQDTSKILTELLGNSIGATL